MDCNRKEINRTDQLKESMQEAKGLGKGGEADQGHRRRGSDPWVGKIPLEEEMATHSSILGWRIPWAEEPSGLQSTGSQRVGHD